MSAFDDMKKGYSEGNSKRGKKPTPLTEEEKLLLTLKQEELTARARFRIAYLQIQQSKGAGASE